MQKKKNKKIVKFHKVSQINIGVVIFAIIFIYMLYNIFQYFTAKQVSAYEVSQGTIAQNNVFTGLALRQEEVYSTEVSGYINYYVRDTAKAGVKTYVYSVDETGDFYHQIAQENQGQLFAKEASYEELEKTAESYVLNYSNMDFYQAYSFQYDMEAALMEALSENALSNLGEYTGNASAFHAYQASQAGIVVYNTDGLEGVDIDSFTAESFDPAAHVKNNLVAREKVNAGDPAYKLITSEIWNLVLPIEASLANDLAEEKNIKVEFKKDNSAAWGGSQIVQRDGRNYLVLTFQNSVVRFAADRYLEVKLLTSDTSGLKIPNSSLTEKEFFSIPKEFLTKGGDSNNNGVLLQTSDEKGRTSMEFTEVTVFQENDMSYYIDGDSIRKGNVLLMPDSNEQYILGETAFLKGVYNINKGYAVFRKVEILFQNEEYTIVDTGTSYGISLYDHIALDASAVKENEIVQ